MVQPLHQTPAGDERRRLMSLAADGEGTPAELAAALKGWQTDEDARQSWHAYHLIGDVLRSDELARPADADEAFLIKLRQRLVVESSVRVPASNARDDLAAPESAHRAAAPKWRWLAPTAAAAAFMGLATVLVVSRVGAPAGPALALAPAATQGAPAQPVAAAMQNPVATGSPTADALSAQALVQGAGGVLVRRDERLDAYLRAHRDSAAANLPWPGGSVRSTSVSTGTPMVAGQR